MIDKSIAMLAALVALAACSAPPVVESPATIPVATAVDHWLSLARAEAAERHAAVVVVAGAEWCEPCNELHQRFWEAPAAATVRQTHVVRDIDVETGLGQAVAARLGVLGYPTTVVLRGEQALTETGRIEGFDTLPEYETALREALDRTQPTPVCAPSDPTELNAMPKLADLKCAAERLRGPAGVNVARLLEDFVQSDAVWRTAAQWPEASRGEVLGALRQLGRWQTRVAGRHGACAQTFAKLQGWPAAPPGQTATLLYWQAKCTLRDGRGSEAKQLIEGWLAASGVAYESRALAADFAVHEALDQPWGAELAHKLLLGMLAEKPDDAWAHYLRGRLLDHQGDRQGARLAVERACQLRPGSALFERTLARLR